jgi:protein phosphatase 4 regulatory subunit 3
VNGVKFLARGGKDEPGTEKFLDYFYKTCMDILFKPLNDVPEAKNFAGQLLECFILHMLH